MMASSALPRLQNEALLTFAIEECWFRSAYLGCRTGELHSTGYESTYVVLPD